MEKSLYLNPKIGFVSDTARDIGIYDIDFSDCSLNESQNESMSKESSENFKRALKKLSQDDSC